MLSLADFLSLDIARATSFFISATAWVISFGLSDAEAQTLIEGLSTLVKPPEVKGNFDVCLKPKFGRLKTKFDVDAEGGPRSGPADPKN